MRFSNCQTAFSNFVKVLLVYVKGLKCISVLEIYWLCHAKVGKLGLSKKDALALDSIQQLLHE